MHRVTRHLRGLLVAFAALVLTAGAVLAARPSTAPPAAAADGLGRASEAAGKTVPVSEQAPAVTEEGAEDGEEEAAPEEEGTEETGEHPENHGKAVSEAAQGETPDGFDNHGQYVKTVAQSDAGKEAQAAAKAERAAARAAAKAAKTNKGHSN